MSRRSRNLSTILPAVLLLALASLVAGCGGEHGAGGGRSAGDGGGSGGADPVGGSAAYLASADDYAGSYSVDTSGGGDNGNNDDSDDNDSGGDLTIGDNGNISGTAPDSDGGTDDLSGIVDSGGGAEIDSSGVNRTMRSVGVLKRAGNGVLVATMTQTDTVGRAAPVTRVVIYRLTKKSAAAKAVAAR